MTEKRVFVLAGLGNPGDRYRDTRHNVGFMVTDRIRDRLECAGPQARFSGVVHECRLEDERLVLLKPMTYMNLSGHSVVQALNWYKVGLEGLLVIYDDLDLSFGEVRLRTKGSAGGHNGLESIIELAGCSEICRLRVGIGRRGTHSGRSYVLSRFDPEQSTHLIHVLDHAADAAVFWWEHGILEAMNQFNGVNILEKLE